MIVDTKTGEILDLEPLRHPPRRTTKRVTRYSHKTRKRSGNHFYALCVTILTKMKWIN